MQDILTRVGHDLKEAMRARDALRKNVLKSLKSALDAESKDKGAGLDDAQMVAVVKRQHKSRVEAAELYAKNGDEGRAETERQEAEVVSSYLPEQMSPGEVGKLIDEAIKGSGAGSVADMGKVMGRLSGQLAGKADMKEVSAAVRERLAK